MTFKPRCYLEMNVRDALVQRLTVHMMRAREAFARFDDDAAERERVGPTWNVRDLAGHLAFWAGEAATRIEALAVGAASKEYDLDRVNEEVYRKNRRMSFVMLLPQLRSAEERLLATLGRVDPKHLIGETDIREWIDVQIAHYQHHFPGLKEAAERLI